ncbi:MAG TPA: GNAT family N-acetyltransferase [Xanthobacteraceae bacterium]|nr:GNAT family N-acetyltransferase [Xanthobacteraceae bacterium]
MKVRLRHPRRDRVCCAAMLQLALKSGLRLRPARFADLDDLLALERAAFTTDRLSSRSLRRFIASPTAALIVAEEAGLAGYALVLFRPRNAVARLYSIAVAPRIAGRGVGALLLAAAEEAARRRGCDRMRLEVHVENAAAINRYRKSGYRQFGCYRHYYDDGGDALRFEKRLAPLSPQCKNFASPALTIAR